MIRTATTSDYPELRELYHDAKLRQHPFIDSEFLSSDIDHRFEQMLPDQDCYLFEQEGEIEGFVAVSGDHLASLIFPTDRQHIGRQLLEHVKSRHQQLHLYCFVENRPARLFYQQQGFEVVGEKVNEALDALEYRMEYGVALSA